VECQEKVTQKFIHHKKKYFTAAQKLLASSSIVRYLGFDVLGFRVINFLWNARK
jgi:hypothetical protein